ncbi:penicillin-binding protein activator LpoB [Cupriavidus sp. MP-37]|uniref:penicillin-binding protein activator LpoB n=1 Tax=Cupriavidus sp. MP-37 TaxID=2884455 RepID=UPI001D09AAD3|nr:penicillin-binding protein activator LpoB [Cupriavidus sp. MP-37]UDM52496.1 penicillin-binding protein activator LpoB [Cupriavidus sp. MP-37]
MTDKTAGTPAAREIGEARGNAARAIPATAALRLAGGMAACGLAALLAGCLASAPNAAGVAALELDAGRKGPVSGVGLEGHDIVAMADQMMRDILAQPRFAPGRDGKRPRIALDGANFINESAQPLDRQLIVDRLRVSLNRAAQSRLQFVSTQTALVERERQAKRSGATDAGTLGLARARLGADYSLSGRIGSLDSRSAATGMVQRYMQISFELVEVETGELVWSNIYAFQRAAADDVVYR